MMVVIISLLWGDLCEHLAGSQESSLQYKQSFSYHSSSILEIHARWGDAHAARLTSWVAVGDWGHCFPNRQINSSRQGACSLWWNQNMNYRCVLGLKGGNKQTSHNVVKEGFLGFFGETKADIKSYKDFRFSFTKKKSFTFYTIHVII